MLLCLFILFIREIIINFSDNTDNLKTYHDEQNGKIYIFNFLGLGRKSSYSTLIKWFYTLWSQLHICLLSPLLFIVCYSDPG